MSSLSTHDDSFHKDTTMTISNSHDSLPTPRRIHSGRTGATPRGSYPIAIELAVLDDATRELTEEFYRYFGPTLSPRRDLLSRLERAGRWSARRAKAARLQRRCRDEERLAWAALRADLKDIIRVFEPLLERHPEIATQVPNLATLVRARRQVSLRGSATRRINADTTHRADSPLESSCASEGDDDDAL
jgi:hypothetical protein